MIKILITIAVAVGGGGFLIYSSMGDASYYKHVDEVLQEPGRWADKSLKVHGFVEAGSIKEEIVGQKATRTFILEHHGKRLRVRHEGVKPDTFKDLAEVVANGRLVHEGDEYILNASELSAKCPSKYEENQRSKQFGSHPENIPRP